MNNVNYFKKIYKKKTTFKMKNPVTLFIDTCTSEH